MQEDQESYSLTDPDSYARLPTDAIYPVQSPYGDIHGLTPPPEDFDILATETLNSNLKPFDLNAEPPTPPRTEAVSSPARSTSPQSPIANSLNRSPPSNPNSPESDISMEHDMDLDLNSLVSEAVHSKFHDNQVGILSRSSDIQAVADTTDFNDNNPFFDFASAASSPKPSAHALGLSFRAVAQPRKFQSSFNDPNFQTNIVSTQNHSRGLTRKRSRDDLDIFDGDDGFVFQSHRSSPQPDVKREEPFGHRAGNVTIETAFTFPPTGTQPSPNFGFSHSFPTSISTNIPSARLRIPEQVRTSTNGQYQLFVDFPKHPTRANVGEQLVKSRVETQIAVRLIVDPPPEGITKLRLPRHTISKIKYIEDTQPQNSPDMWELDVSLVCASAMVVRDQAERALYEARGEPLPKWILDEQKTKLAMDQISNQTSVDSSNDSKESLTSKDDNKKYRVDYGKPLFGANVQICEQCMNRERKRASRKKNKKPDEEQKWQQDEKKRIIVFNTNQVRQFESLPNRSGISAETQMRICCYCRHHGEKDGFRVIFTIRNHLGAVVAQTMSNTIVITDDHKNTAAAAAINFTALPDTAERSMSMSQTPPPPVPAYTQPSVSINHIQTASELLSAAGSPPAYTISNFSNQALPNSRTNGHSNPPTPARASTSPSHHQPKRRKSSKVPATLAMTPSDHQPLFSTQFQPSFNPRTPKTEMTSNGNQWLASPTTPMAQQNFAAVGEDYFAEVNWSPQSQFTVMKSPASSHANAFSIQVPMTMAPAQQIPQFQQNPSVNRVVPSEGTMRGGIEITVLGRNFVNGLTVLFGDNPATDTAFYSDTTLLCRLPPNQTPGAVVVSLKNMPVTTVRPESFPIFTYIDDVEKELMHLALTVVGMKMKGSQSGSSRQVALNILQESGMSADALSSSSGGSNHQAELESKMLACLDMIDMDESPHPPKLTFRNKSGQSMLHLACMLGMQKFVAALLARGVNANSRDKNGYTPLHFAAFFKRSDVVRRLLINRADAGLRTRNGETAADLGESEQIFRATRSIQQTHSRQHSRSSSVSSESRFGRNRTISTNGSPSNRASVDEYYDSSDDSSDISDAEEPEHDSSPVWSSSRRGSNPSAAPGPIPIDTAGVQKAVHAAGGLATATSAASGTNDPPSPPAAMVAWMDAWREQFTQSIQNLQLNMPAIPAAAEYQNMFQNHMARFQNPMLKWKPHQKDDQDYKWSELFHPPAPPAYEELYPHGNDGPSDSVNGKSTDSVVVSESSITAAIQRPRSVSPRLSAMDLKELHRQITSGEGQLTETQKVQHLAHLRKLKRIESDRRLFFIWIPVLIIIMTLMAFNRGPAAWAAAKTAANFAREIIEDPQGVRDRWRIIEPRTTGIPGE
ncbi:hypothetical protein EDC01DRAFT_428775 [Geopyxis carbonaria]|nr:hypothetical protein EDC01DRAFT_428775 [Geopyxis carbonaria]